VPPLDTPPTRIGVVGVNDRAYRLLLPGLAASRRAAVAAVCSRDLHRARAAAETLGNRARAFDSVGEMAQSGLVDAVYVNTPADRHVEPCLAAIEAGCHVICEKPLAATTAAAQALLRAAERHRVRTAVNFTYRSVPGYRVAERLLVDPGIGRPLHAEVALLQGHNFLPGFPAASALLDSGVHLFDLLLSQTAAAGCGAVTEVCATPMLPAEECGPDFGWTFLARTASGALVNAAFTRSALGWRNGLCWSLYGDDAAVQVELDADRTDVRLAVRGDGRPQGTWRSVPLPEDVRADDKRFPAYHLDRLVAAIRGDASFPSFAEAVATHVLADALAASAAARSWVPLALPVSGRPGARAAGGGG
jgi:predicted dehydrogenase